MADTVDDESHDRFPPLHGTSRLSRQHRSMRTQHALRSFPFQGRQDLRRKLGRERVFSRPQFSEALQPLSVIAGVLAQFGEVADT
jgi:hypothetical protein